MTPEEFARQLHSSIVDNNDRLYRELFKLTDPNAVRDPYWFRAMGLYSSLTNEQQGVFFEIIRQVIVDTVSSCLAVLDDASRLSGQKEDFTLQFGSSPQRLNGGLQDCFLAMEEKP